MFPLLQGQEFNPKKVRTLQQIGNFRSKEWSILTLHKYLTTMPRWSLSIILPGCLPQHHRTPSLLYLPSYPLNKWRLGQSKWGWCRLSPLLRRVLQRFDLSLLSVSQVLLLHCYRAIHIGQLAWQCKDVVFFPVLCRA